MGKVTTVAKRKPFNIDAGDNADWPKQTWDLPYTTVAQVRAWLRSRGVTIAEFKRTPAYRLALPRNPWLKKL